MKDSDLISRNFYELHYASMELGVPESTVLKALEDLHPNNKREDVYAYIRNNFAVVEKPIITLDVDMPPLSDEDMKRIMTELSNQQLQFYKSEDENNKEEQEILHSAIMTFGTDHQVDKFIEESCEAIQAILKLKSKSGFALLNKDNIKEFEDLHAELADVWITLDQMMIMFDKERIDLYRDKKLARLKQRIEDYGKPNL